MTLLYPLLVVLLAVFAVAPLEYPGAFQSHTGLLAVYNLINLDQNPLQFLSWAPTVGHSFDLLRGEGMLPYLFALVFHHTGLSYLNSVKLVYALAWIGSGLTMYLLASKILSRPGALLAATGYLYLPFHLSAVYVRGAFAESVAWAILPIALASALFPPPPARSRAFVLSLLPFALLFLTQPGIALVAGLVTLAIAGALNWRRERGLRHSLVTVLAGLGCGALVFVPTLLRYGARILPDGFTPNWVFPFQLFSPMWGYGASTGGFLDQFPLQLGVVPISLTIVACALAGRDRSGSGSDHAGVGHDLARRALIVFAAAAAVLALLTFEIASPLWTVLRAFFAFPWQLLILAGLALALAAGSIVDLDERLEHPAMLSVLVILPVIATYGYLTPQWLDFSPVRPQIAIFGNNEIALLDYRIVGPLRHGATLRVEFRWQALRQVDHDYTVFVHAVNQDDGKTYGEEDAKPQDGTLPTIKWAPGQVVSDTHTIQIDVDGPRENYVLEVGLYQSANGYRAVLDTGQDHLILPRAGDPEPTISDQIPVAKNP